jgi:hypothetical protein
MLRLTAEELSRVQVLYRVLPRWKRGEFLQELARRMQGREIGDADLRREGGRRDGDARGARSRPRLGAGARLDGRRVQIARAQGTRSVARPSASKDHHAQGHLGEIS